MELLHVAVDEDGEGDDDGDVDATDAGEYVVLTSQDLHSFYKRFTGNQFPYLVIWLPFVFG